MTRDLSRLIRPKSIAVIGGGAWCAEVIRQSEKIGFTGDIWPVHPKANTVLGHQTYATIADLPAPPDASFIGINRHATVQAVDALAQQGAGGAVCFASGFSEAASEDADGAALQDALRDAAGEMPILGPNCYGLINALDGAALWPDQHGCSPVDSGVAILTQSSNIAINLTNQRRGLPIAYVATCGNMAQLNQAEIAQAFLEDPRVTAIGLHIEGFTNLRAWEAFARRAAEKSIPVVVLKVGASAEAQAATVSHTASLAGSDAGARALIRRLGFARVHELPVLLETLKLLHMQGPLKSNRIASISCSGGEASLMADTALGTGLSFPPLSTTQHAELRQVLGPMVALANPLDYHTYIWRDATAMAAAWTAMAPPDIAMTFTVVDYPHENRSDWACATQAAITAHANTERPFAVAASLPELMPEDVAKELIAGGVVPFYGLREALAATVAAAQIAPPDPTPLLLPGDPMAPVVLDEARAKAELEAHGVDVPHSQSARGALTLQKAAEGLQPPLVLKGLGIAHKTEAGAVRLNLTAATLESAAQPMPTEQFLIEEMVTDAVAEVLIGVTRDAAHGFVLTLAAGGVLTELLEDSTSCLIPASRTDLREALLSLKIAKQLTGYRGAPPASIEAILDAAEALQAYVLANRTTLEEVEINPLICTPTRAVAADALIRKELT
ncbi:acetate--CoA ligase family protein [Shimia marina]|uniref:Acetyl coenzyme A synthetase (ADP forming), alpha domain n=1 Tax=Shimia marina TaxID=321267 RepID=A0A0P1FA67_9RHOB|nr:acetate--CoA ligase family protein [Shimia marina]CUH51302.1 acetyl coenzyme A synthetase (ADP forming), alpha domain [Shimia marina]SFD52627.1 Acyl-CoA synthetase (NDP forming) [Shimia marina]